MNQRFVSLSLILHVQKLNFSVFIEIPVFFLQIIDSLNKKLVQKVSNNNDKMMKRRKQKEKLQTNFFEMKC